MLINLLKKYLTVSLLKQLLKSDIGHQLIDNLLEKARHKAEETNNKLDDITIEMIKLYIHKELDLTHDIK